MDWKENKGAYTDNKITKKLFGIETGKRLVRRFRLFFRDGGIMSVPYALLPLIILEPNKSLKIKAQGIEVVVKGRNLGRVEEWMNEEKLLWLKEANTTMDDNEKYEVFIASISVEGDLVF